MKRLSLSILIAAAALAQNPAAPTVPPREDGVYAIFNTAMGAITVKLYDKEAPVTVRNFIALARGTKPWSDPKTGTKVAKPLYNGIVFHRVVAGVMIQGGDPTATGMHNCGFTIKDEIVPSLKFDKPGRLAMANIGRPNTGACQWFITEAPYPAWDGGYTIFGQVVDGQDVVSKISHLPVNGDRPVNPPKLVSVRIQRVGPPPVPPAAKKSAAPVKK